ncbi:MAG: HAD-IB family hydrolase [Gammaproteobacteria bacterium]|nr:HAD-IB family hydrolase [Gammaproteobacteria bacterium]
MIVAAFDFDGTLTYRDSLLPFLRFMSGSVTFTQNLVRLSPVLFRLSVGMQDRHAAKEAFLRRFVTGMPRSNLEEYGRTFAREKIARMLRDEGMKRLKWHQQQKHTCILISASLDTYLEHWTRLHNFDHLVCSKLEYDSNGCATGMLSGSNCRGAEKVRRLYDAVGRESITELYAYGDSSGDKELLAAADHSFLKKFSE